MDKSNNTVKLTDTTMRWYDNHVLCNLTGDHCQKQLDKEAAEAEAAKAEEEAKKAAEMQ